MTAYLAAPDPIPTGYDKLDQLLGGGMVRGLEIVGEGNALARSLTLAHDLELLAALGNELVFVDRSGFGRGGGVVVRHLKRLR